MKRKILFNDMSEHVKNVFNNDEETFEEYRSLLFDLGSGKDVYDEDGNLVKREDAEEKALSFTQKIFGIDKNSTKRQRKRAVKAHKDEFFAVSEEVIDMKIETGFKETEFFTRFVDNRNIARGDSVEFWTEDKVYLSVVKRGQDNHDFTVQRLGSGQSYTVGLSVYGIAVGADIDLYLAGRLDWSKFTDQCAAAFLRQIQTDSYLAVMNVGDKLPAQFVKTGTLGTATKDKFDELIEDVSMVNDNSPLFIMGTKTALKKLNGLADIDWVTNEQKGEMASMGRLGSYEGVTLFEIPQRFALDDISKKLIDSTKLFVMPQADNKFVKMVDQGETEITEVTEKAARQDDTMKYTVERAFGIGVQLERYFGIWNLE